MQDQIQSFATSLQSIAAEYSDPAVILKHVPIVQDHLDTIQPVLDNWQYALGGLVALFVLRRILKKRKASKTTPTAMVMPPPYYGEDSTLGDTHPLNADTKKAKDTAPEPAQASSLDRLANMVSPRQPRSAEPAAPQKRSAADMMTDIAAVSFQTRPALSADEARMRVIVQAALTEMRAPLIVMARTALSSLLEPGAEAVGPARANAIAALESKVLEFGLFDHIGAHMGQSTQRPAASTERAARAERPNRHQRPGRPSSTIAAE